jgi:hypothetical protein
MQTGKLYPAAPLAWRCGKAELAAHPITADTVAVDSLSVASPLLDRLRHVADPRRLRGFAASTPFSGARQGRDIAGLDGRANIAYARRDLHDRTGVFAVYGI